MNNSHVSCLELNTKGCKRGYHVRVHPSLNDINSVLSCHIETVVLLRGVKTDSHISVDLDVEKLGLKTVK